MILMFDLDHFLVIFPNPGYISLCVAYVVNFTLQHVAEHPFPILETT